jgi:3-hydroxyacyl-[acyl-carrier-protein] dehydratase
MTSSGPATRGRLARSRGDKLQPDYTGVFHGGRSMRRRSHREAQGRMDLLTLPLDYAAIERVLPHRYPFLLVDRITEFEPDRRIVGVKNVSLNERYLAHPPGERPVLPPTILTECVAQVGAILILAKPENREKLPFFAGIERVRYRRPVHPGDVVVIEAVVKRMRSRMGVLRGVARVEGKVVVEGTMTFALGSRGAADGSS